jgi:hypothetical protein
MSNARVFSVDISTILSDASILERVFSFLPGHWLYLGAVCRAWMQSYKDLPLREIVTVDCCEDWSTTLMESAFQSPSRLRLAVACDLQLSGPDEDDTWLPPSAVLQYIAGLHADEAVLSLAKELGMPLSGKTVKGAAASGRVSVLEYLIQQQRCW